MTSMKEVSFTLRYETNHASRRCSADIVFISSIRTVAALSMTSLVGADPYLMSATKWTGAQRW